MLNGDSCDKAMVWNFAICGLRRTKRDLKNLAKWRSDEF